MFSIMTILLFIIVTLPLLLSYLRTLRNYLRKVKVHVQSMSNKHRDKVVCLEQAPGPAPWPILGNLVLLGRYEVPFQGFSELAKQYGDIFALTLGSTRCLVVNNLELIREVLNQNGKFFGGRPDFLRYHKLFGGDRNNSLALCDWSQLQQKRRNLARRHCSPRDSSSYFTNMSNVGCMETSLFMEKLHEEIVPGKPFHVKQLIQQTCANMFMQYMCSTRFNYDDIDFQKIVEYFDEIFWEINQGYPIDFLPWLAVFYKKHLNRIINWSSTIRRFILQRIIDNREHNIDLEEPEKDFTDALLKSLAKDDNVSRDTIIFMLEDFIGGHSAVGNLVMLALTYIAKNPHVGQKIQTEVDHVSEKGKNKISLHDMDSMPYTMATIFEVLRYSSSPIVPHVATEDAVIKGYGVTKGTIVFINNYNLNTSDKYWKDPQKFDPERFLERTLITTKMFTTPTNEKETKRRNSEGSDSGIEFEKDLLLITTNSDSQLHDLKFKNAHECYYKLQVKKNIPHFLPFSIGKRTCIGQNLVRGFGFILLANILQKYNITIENTSEIKINPACVALPSRTFPLKFTLRN